MAFTSNSIALNAIPVEEGGTGDEGFLVGSVILGDGTSALSQIALSDAQTLYGQTGANPMGVTITAGTGISVNLVGADLVISGTAVGLAQVNQTGTSVTMAPNTEYFANSGSLITFTIPATSAFGDTYIIRGFGGGGWALVWQTGQSLFIGTAVLTTSTGSLTSTQRYDAVQFQCMNADTDFIGNILQGNPAPL